MGLNTIIWVWAPSTQTLQTASQNLRYRESKPTCTYVPTRIPGGHAAARSLEDYDPGWHGISPVGGTALARQHLKWHGDWI
jgi:hypothetical protein